MRSIVPCFVSLLVLFHSVAFAQSYPPPWPRDGVQKVLENDRVIVWEVEWLKRPTGMHRHAYDLVVVTTQAGAISIETPDGVTTKLEAAHGAVGFQAKDVIHNEWSVSDPPRKAVVVELKERAVRPAPGRSQSSYPPPWPRDGVKKVLENERVIVWEVEWLKTPTGMHEHRYDLVVVTTQAGAIDITTPDGATTTLQASLGQSAFQAQGVIHDERSASDPPRKGVVIEVKN